MLGKKMSSFPNGGFQTPGGLTAARNLAGAGAERNTGEAADAVSEAVADAGMMTGEVVVVDVAVSGDEKAGFHRSSDGALQANVPGGEAGHGEKVVQ